MMKVYWILSIAMATLCSQATGDIAALEKKIKLLETRINSIQATGARKVETLEKQLKGHDTKMEVFNTRLEELKSKSFSCNMTMYSFSTRLHEDTDINDGPVIFGTVDLNVGDGYDEFTGVFHAPVSGLYLLSVYATTGNDAGYLFIKKNDEDICRTWITAGQSPADDVGLDKGTCTGITELTPGDSVRVTGNTDDPARIPGSDSGFIGHLIQPYC